MRTICTDVVACGSGAAGTVVGTVATTQRPRSGGHQARAGQQKAAAAADVRRPADLAGSPPPSGATPATWPGCCASRSGSWPAWASTPTPPGRWAGASTRASARSSGGAACSCRSPWSPGASLLVRGAPEADGRRARAGPRSYLWVGGLMVAVAGCGLLHLTNGRPGPRRAHRRPGRRRRPARRGGRRSARRRASRRGARACSSAPSRSAGSSCSRACRCASPPRAPPPPPDPPAPPSPTRSDASAATSSRWATATPPATHGVAPVRPGRRRPHRPRRPRRRAATPQARPAQAEGAGPGARRAGRDRAARDRARPGGEGLAVEAAAARRSCTAAARQEVDKAAVEAAGHVLEQALAQHGVETKLVGMVVGPSVTRYELELGPGVKVARVTSLHKDIAYAMASPDVRILAPIPGRQAIGVEVPNTDRHIVACWPTSCLGRGQAASHPLELAVGVGHLDADGLPARDRGQDADVGRRHRVGDVLVEARDAGDLHAGAELELVAGDRRADDHADELVSTPCWASGLLEDAARRPRRRPCRPPAALTVRAGWRAAASTASPSRPGRARSRAASPRRARSGSGTVHLGLAGAGLAARRGARRGRRGRSARRRPGRTRRTPASSSRPSPVPREKRWCRRRRRRRRWRRRPGACRRRCSRPRPRTGTRVRTTSPPMRDRGQDEGGAPRRQPRRERAGGGDAEQAAGVDELVGGGVEARTPAGEVQETAAGDGDHAGHRPRGRSATPVGLAVLGLGAAAHEQHAARRRGPTGARMRPHPTTRADGRVEATADRARPRRRRRPCRPRGRPRCRAGRPGRRRGRRARRPAPRISRSTNVGGGGGRFRFAGARLCPRCGAVGS